MRRAAASAGEFKRPFLVLSTAVIGCAGLDCLFVGPRVPVSTALGEVQGSEALAAVSQQWVSLALDESLRRYAACPRLRPPLNLLAV